MSQEVLMIIEKASHRFRYYDMETKAVLKEIKMPDFPHEFAITLDEKYAYIGCYGVINSGSTEQGDCQIWVLDIPTGEIINKIIVQDAEHGPMYRPHGIERDEKGALYALSESGDRLFYKADPTSGDSFDYSVPTGGTKGHLFALTRDGKRAFVSNLTSGDVTAINPHEALEKPVILETGVKPEGRCLSPDEKTLFITNRGDNTISVIDVATMALKSTLDTGEDPVRVYYDVKRDRIIAINFAGKSMSIYQVSDGTLVQIVEFDQNPAGLTFMNNGDWCMIPFMDQKIRMYDLQTYQQVDEMQSGLEPDGIYVIAKDKLAFV